MDKNGRLIVFEGGDNVGKSTIIKTLVEDLESKGQVVSQLAFPGNQPHTLGKWVYDYHHAPANSKANQTSLQMLHVAAHIDCIENQIVPFLKDGQLVVLDRFWWSTWVYGIVGGVSEQNLKRMISIEKNYWGEILPSCVFWLRRRKAEIDPFQQKVCGEYRRLTEMESGNHPVFEICNESTVDAALSNIVSHLTSLDLMSPTKSE